MHPLPSNFPGVGLRFGVGKVFMGSQRAELGPELESEGSRKGHREATLGSK